jgi:hypothetical protein
MKPEAIGRIGRVSCRVELSRSAARRQTHHHHRPTRSANVVPSILRHRVSICMHAGPECRIIVMGLRSATFDRLWLLIIRPLDRRVFSGRPRPGCIRMKRIVARHGRLYGRANSSAGGDSGGSRSRCLDRGPRLGIGGHAAVIADRLCVRYGCKGASQDENKRKSETMLTAHHCDDSTIRSLPSRPSGARASRPEPPLTSGLSHDDDPVTTTDIVDRTGRSPPRTATATDRRHQWL